MSQVEKLQALLGRIKRNASAPRATPSPSAQAAPAITEGPDELPLDEDTAHELPVTLAENEIPDAPAIVPAAAAAREDDAQLEELEEFGEELTEDLMEDAATPLGDELVDELSEAVPASAPRPALAAQPELEELDLEPPVKTPPPESGRQAVSPVAEARPDEIGEEVDLAGGSDVDSLLEADLGGAPISKAPPGVPTMEQLGETVELEGADGPAATLELGEATVISPSARPPEDEFELELPGKAFQGAYDASLAPPESARADLERLRSQEEDRAAALAATSAASTFSAPPPGSLSSAPPSGPTSVSAPTLPGGAVPVVIARPPQPAVAYVAEMVTSKAVRTPETFLELLDQSLAL